MRSIYLSWIPISLILSSIGVYSNYWVKNNKNLQITPDFLSGKKFIHHKEKRETLSYNN